MKKIQVRISKDGKVSVDVTGVEGASCEELTEQLTAALGQVEDTEHKDEFFVDLVPDYAEVIDE